MHRRQDTLPRAIASPYGAIASDRDRDRRTRVAPSSRQVMGHTHHMPLTSDVVQAAQQKPAEAPRFFDLAKHRFHDHFAPGVQGLVRWVSALSPPCAPWRWRVASSPQPQRHGGAAGLLAMYGSEASLLHGRGGGRAVIATVIGGRNLLRSASGVCGQRHAGLLQVSPPSAGPWAPLAGCRSGSVRMISRN